MTTNTVIHDGKQYVFPDEDGKFVLSDGSLGNPGCDGCGTRNATIKLDGTYLCEDMDPRLQSSLGASFEKVAGPLPAHPETGWRRDEVYGEPYGCSIGDTQVGGEYTARYRSADGTKVCDLAYVVEDLREMHNRTDIEMLNDMNHDRPDLPPVMHAPFIVTEVTHTYGVRFDEEGDEIPLDDDDYEYGDGGMFAYATVAEAEAEARRLADNDWRFCFTWEG